MNSLTAWGEPLTFRTGAGAGFFNTTGKDTSRIIGTVAPGTVATIQVRVWESLGGYYYAAMLGGFKYGHSPAFTVVTGGAGSPPSLPANLIGLTGFFLIPEPATFALFAAGAVALFLRRRR
jgi:hypothetical protein